MSAVYSERTVARNWPERRAVDHIDPTKLERRGPVPTATQVAESERRAENRFKAVPARHTAMGDLL